MERLRKATLNFLRELFAGEEVPLFTDRQTGEQVIDMQKVCEKLGLDFEQVQAKLLTDPVLSKGVRIITPESDRCGGLSRNLTHTAPVAFGGASRSGLLERSALGERGHGPSASRRNEWGPGVPLEAMVAQPHRAGDLSSMLPRCPGSPAGSSQSAQWRCNQYREDWPVSDRHA